MKPTKIIFLRHADTQKDPLVNAALWGLSEKGKDQAIQIANDPIMSAIDIIYTSDEPKTTLTIEPLANKLSKIPSPLPFFNEVRRGDKFLTKEEFEHEKVRQLTDLSFKAFDGESGFDALARFKNGIVEVTQHNAGKTICIVTHGTILNIYFSSLLGNYDELPNRWSNTAFCAYGIVEDDRVVKDIV